MKNGREISMTNEMDVKCNTRHMNNDANAK